MPRPESVSSRMRPKTRNSCETKAKNNEAKLPKWRPNVKVLKLNYAVQG